jgi:hypothetical protein
MGWTRVPQETVITFYIVTQSMVWWKSRSLAHWAIRVKFDRFDFLLELLLDEKTIKFGYQNTYEPGLFTTCKILLNELTLAPVELFRLGAKVEINNQQYCRKDKNCPSE